jgi:hypothetical protein
MKIYVYKNTVEAAKMASKSREKFVSLTEKRVSRTLKDIRLIGNLSNKSNYSYTEEDVRKILAALDSELKNLRKRFESSGISDSTVFKL